MYTRMAVATAPTDNQYFTKTVITVNWPPDREREREPSIDQAVTREKDLGPFLFRDL